MDFKTKIDNFMKEQSISNIKQLALKSDIPYTTLRDCYEKNNTDNSRMSTMRKLAKYMDCTTDYLGYSEIENPKGTIPNLNMVEKKNDFNQLDNVIIAKAKELTDEDKMTILRVIESINKDIDSKK